MLQQDVIAVVGATAAGGRFSVVMFAALISFHHGAAIGGDNGGSLVRSNVQTAVIAAIQEAAGEVICTGNGPQKIPLAALQFPGTGIGGRGSGKGFPDRKYAEEQYQADE